MLNKYYRFSKVAGIAIELDRSGNAVFHVCVVTLNGSELTINKKEIGIKDINELRKVLPPKIAVAINITGKGILIKEAERIEGSTSEVITKILPNASLTDFYIQHFISGNKSFIGLIRTQEAEKWVNQIKELGFAPLQLSLGPFAIDHILSQLNTYNNELIFNGWYLKWDEHQHLKSYTTAEDLMATQVIKIENEKIDEKLLVPYATAFQLALTDKIQPIIANVPDLNIELNEALGTVKWKVRGALFLCFLFVALLVNFILFSYYDSANATLVRQLGQSAKDVSISESLTDSIKIKKSLLDSLGWEHDINKSILIDQIAQVLPQEVKWNQVAIDPPVVLSNESRMAFTDRQISVAGNCENLIPVNEWIARLRTKAWIKSAELKNFSYNNEEKTGHFIVLINY